MHETKLILNTDDIRDISNYKCIKNMDLNDYSIFDYINSLSKKINIDFQTLYMYPNWFLIDKNYYYFKSKFILNELIMSEILKRFNLPYLDYELAKCDNITGILSKSYRDKNKIYFYYNDFMNYINAPYDINCIERFKSILSSHYSEDIVKSMVNILYKTISIDFMFGQRDRENYNVLFELESNNINFLPTYDNGNILKKSFKNEYYSCFESLSFPTDNNIDFHNEYTLEVLSSNTTLLSAFISSMNIDLSEVFKTIEEKYSVIIDKNSKKLISEYYDNQRKTVEYSLKLIQ